MVILLFTRKVILDARISGANLRNLGPMQSSPVDFVVSRLDKYFLTKPTFITGMSKYVSGSTFELTKFLKFSKADIWIVSFKFEATLTKYVLKILAIFFSLDILHAWQMTNKSSCWGLMTRQPLWVILCLPSEKRKKEIEDLVEEMKERDTGERGTGMKVKKQKK